MCESLDRPGVRAEVALRLGDIVDAEFSLSKCSNGAESSNSARSLVRYRSLQLQLMLLAGGEIADEFLNAMITLHDITKKSLVQDYTVESLLLGLERANRLADAERIAVGYVHEYRRATSPISASLAAIISRLALFSKLND
jgi:hypothetical protein